MDELRLVVLDVNETLSDLDPLRQRFADLGLDPQLSATWFASVLRDGFALTALEQMHGFADLGSDALRDLAPGIGDDDVESVLDTFTSLSLHPDVVPGLRRLAEAGIEVVTLSNGSTGVAEGLLQRAGVRDLVADVLSVDDVGVWKPHPRAYAHALAGRDADAGQTALVAVHPWDLHGASSAGLRTAWIRRGERHWPGAFTAPDVTADGLDAAAERLMDGGAGPDSRA